MREASFEALASTACELATLLLVVEECDVNQVERENLISLARRVSDALAVNMLELGNKGGENA